MNPTPEQVEYLKRACGTKRFIYNWGRAQWEQQYQAYKAEQEAVPEEQCVLKPPSALALKKQFNAIREQQYPWTYEVTKCVVKEPLMISAKPTATSLPDAQPIPTTRKRGKRASPFPFLTINSRGEPLDQHSRSGAFHPGSAPDEKGARQTAAHTGNGKSGQKLRFVEQGKVTSAKKKRKQRKQVPCKSVKILGATVSCEAGHYYVSIQVQIKKQQPPTPTAIVGVDVGIKQAAVVSDGRVLENQKPLARHLKKLGKLQRRLSKKQRTKDPATKRTVFSKNYEKQRLKVDASISRLPTSGEMCSTNSPPFSHEPVEDIGIENLNILGMMADHKLARAVADAAMGQLLQFLKTKVASAGGEIFIASRWFPSTKRCSCCGHVKKRMPLKHRTYKCLLCGLVIDRDLNAALNLAWFATEQLRHLPA